MAIASILRSAATSESSEIDAAAFGRLIPTVLSQDVLNTDTIPVHSDSHAPAAPFTNPASGGQASRSGR